MNLKRIQRIEREIKNRARHTPRPAPDLTAFSTAELHTLLERIPPGTEADYTPEQLRALLHGGAQ